jgi:hypothetical protein
MEIGDKMSNSFTLENPPSDRYIASSSGDKKAIESALHRSVRGFIQKFSDWVDNEMNNNNEYSLRSNTKDYGGKTH